MIQHRDLSELLWTAIPCKFAAVPDYAKGMASSSLLRTHSGHRPSRLAGHGRTNANDLPAAVCQPCPDHRARLPPRSAPSSSPTLSAQLFDAEEPARSRSSAPFTSRACSASSAARAQIPRCGGLPFPEEIRQALRERGISPMMHMLADRMATPDAMRRSHRSRPKAAPTDLFPELSRHETEKNRVRPPGFGGLQGSHPGAGPSRLRRQSMRATIAGLNR